MRVSTTSINTNLINELNRLNQQQTKLQNQLATQQKINKAQDNPLAFGEITEDQSRTRSMQSFRANLDRAQLMSDLSKDSLSLLKKNVAEAENAADIFNASINNPQQMRNNANLLDTLIEQGIEAVNTSENGKSLFAGKNFNGDAFNVARGEDGKTTSKVGGIRQEVGDPPPKLVEGNYYRIENASGVDFQVAGAESNEAGTVFRFNGEDIDWIPGSGAALSPVAKNISEEDADRLVKGRAYEIVKKGENTEFRDSGAPSNQVGSQFIFNGEEPLEWDGAELAPLEADFDDRIQGKDFQDYEFYQVTSGDVDAFEENAVDPIIRDTFQFNGSPVEEKASDAVKLSTPVQQGEEDKLVSGKLYQVVDSDGTFAGGGAPPGVQTGDSFVFDGSEITEWGNATLLPVGLEAGTTFDQGNPGPLVDGEYYFINSVGGDNFSNLSNPPNPGSIGSVFQFDEDAAPPPEFGANGELIPLETSLDPSELDPVDIGQAFAVVGGNGSLSGGGAGLNSQPGTRFIYDGTPFQPQDFGGAKLTPLAEDPQQPLQKNDLFKIADLSSKGKELPPLEEDNEILPDRTYRIENLGNNTDLTGVFNETGPFEEGDIVTTNSNPAQPPEWDGAQLKSIAIDAQGPITGVDLQEGKSYRIAEATGPTAAKFRLGDGNSLIEGETYTITNNGSTANFSQIGGEKSPDNGSVFTTPGAGALSAADVNFAGSILKEVGGGNDPITSKGELQANTQYQVVDNGSNTDFTLSGAQNNKVGTTFTYNGDSPSFGNGELSQDFPATDYTEFGAPNNNAGTLFTATKDGRPEWGVGGELEVFRPERTNEADLRDIGAKRNEVGETFNFNGNATVFDNANEAGSTLFGYQREVLSVEYAGSSENAEGFKIAENIDFSPFSRAKDNQRFEDVLNRMVNLRDAFRLAADAEEGDKIAQFAAREKLNEAGSLISGAEEDVDIAKANLEMHDIALETAASKDDKLYKNLNDIEDKRRGIDPETVVTQLEQTRSAFQTAINSGALIGQSNLFDFI